MEIILKNVPMYFEAIYEPRAMLSAAPKEDT